MPTIVEGGVAWVKVPVRLWVQGTFANPRAPQQHVDRLLAWELSPSSFPTRLLYGSIRVGPLGSRVRSQRL